MRKIYASQKEYYRSAYMSGEKPPWSGEKPAEPDRMFAAHIARAIKLLRSKSPRPLPSRFRALDIGCGQGRHTAELARAGFYAVGMDYLSQPIHARAVKGKKRGQAGFAFITADFFHAPFHPGSFHTAADYGVYHHILKRDVPLFVETISRLLKPRGLYILACFSRKFRHADGKRHPRGYVVHKRHYDRFLTKREIFGDFGKKFEILDLKENNQAGFFHALMRKKR